MSGYAFHPEAFTDLDEIGHTSQTTTSTQPTGYSPTSTSLSAHSRHHHIGHRRPDLTTRPLRFQPVRDEYLIAYAPDEKPLWVVAVIHGRRNPRVLAAILRGREGDTR